MFNNIKYNAYHRIWKKLVKRHDIKDESAVLILAGDNEKIDEIAQKRLSDYANKRYANAAFIIAPNYYKKTTFTNDKTIYLPKKKIDKLYQLYCFYRFNNNIVFTFINVPKDNKLSKYLSESVITEEEIVCLALYRLGKV